MTATNAVGRVRVWILPAAAAGTGYAFPWSLDFIEEKRLLPLKGRRTAGSKGSASFRLLRARRDDGEGDGLVNDPGSIIPGGYIAVTAGVDEFDVEAVQWWGYISKIDRQQVAGLDSIGTVEALEVGHLLDGGRLTGWQQDTGLGGTSLLSSPPTWNLTDRHGTVVGNVTSVSGDPVFAHGTSDCQVGVGAAYGTRYGLLRHVCEFTKPAALPNLVPADTGGAVFTYLDDDSLPEVLDVRDCTLHGAINVIVPRPRGFGWKVSIFNAESWYIDVYPLIASADGPGSGYPTGSGETVTLDDHETIDFRHTQDGADIYDSVTIEGARIVHCASAMMGDNATNAWSTGQETAYRAGTAVGADEKVSDWKERNSQLRAGPGLCDVFTRYKINEPPTGPLGRSLTPGESASSTSTPWFPEVSWSGAALAINQSAPRDPYWPAARILRTIPWPVGVDADGTDNRDQDAQVRPTYMKPQVFRYLLTADAAVDGGVWQDLSQSYKQRAGAEVECDDRLPALHIRMSPPELLAKDHWNSTTDARAKVDPNNSSTKLRAIDWESLVITVAMEGDQRVRVQRIRPGLTSATVRRDLPLTYDKLECWVVHTGTVLAVDADGEAERVATTTFTRNDWPVAQRLCDMAAAWSFRSRRSGTIELARPDDPPAWAEIGTMIGTVIDGDGSVELNTVVEDVAFDWTVEKPRLTITTTLPDRPDFKSLAGSASPTAGGPVSVGLGGTVAQAVQNLRGQVNRLERDAQRMPLVLSRADVLNADDGELDGRRIDVYQEAHGFDNGDWVVVGTDGDEGVDYAKATLQFVLPAPDGADNPVRRPVVGVVVDRIDADRVSIMTGGFVEGLVNSDPDAVGDAFEPGQAYELHPTEAGCLTKSRTNAGIALFVATGPQEGYICIARDSDGIMEAGTVLGADDSKPATVAGAGLADAATLTGAEALVAYAGEQLSCRWGGVFLPDYTGVGPHWVHPTVPGQLVTTRPTTPADQKPVLFSWGLGQSHHVVLPFNMEKGLGDLWDVDLSTPPADEYTIKWDATAKRWKPGAAGSSDGGDIDANTILLTGLAKIASMSVLGNAGDTDPDDVAAILCNGAGRLLISNQAFNAIAFTELPHVGDALLGDGGIRINFGIDKYVEIFEEEVIVYFDANHQFKVEADAKVSIIWPNGNSVVLDKSHVAGTARSLRIREVDICDATGAPKKMQGLFTDLYT